MKKKIAIVLNASSLGALSTEQISALFFGNSPRARAIVRGLKDHVLASIYLTYEDGESATFLVEAPDGQSVEVHDSLKTLGEELQDDLLADDSLDKLLVFSTDSGFPMMELNNFGSGGTNAVQGLGYGGYAPEVGYEPEDSYEPEGSY